MMSPRRLFVSAFQSPFLSSLLSSLLFIFLFILMSVASAGSAFAQATASVAFENIRYDLIDLDLGDGIDPSITVRPYFPGQASFANALIGDASGQREPLHIGANVLSPVSVGDTYTNPATAPPTVLSASSSLSGSLPDGMALHSTASGAQAAVGVGVCCVGYWAMSYVETGTVRFTLSPNSAIRFSLDMSASLAGTGAPMPGKSMVAAATGRFVTVEDFEGANTFGEAQLTLNSWVDAPGSVSRHVEQLVSNPGATVRENLFYAYGSARVNALPVPEPARMAMLLTGLGVLAPTLLARRAGGRRRPTG